MKRMENQKQCKVLIPTPLRQYAEKHDSVELRAQRSARY